MALETWRVVHRVDGLVALQAEQGSLILEAARPAGGDPDLRDVVARLAPQLSFGAVQVRGSFVERLAITGDERVIIGRCTRGTRSAAYLVALRAPIDIDEVVVSHLGEVESPFEYLAD